MSDEKIEHIKAALSRLRAREDDVGREGIIVGDRGHGHAVLQCRTGRDLDWFGPADEILDRLSGLPDGAGPEAVRSEFA